MANLDESNQTSENMDSENATTITNNGNEEIVHPDIACDHESKQIGPNKQSSDLSFQVLDYEHDENHNENSTIKVVEHPEPIPCHVVEKKIMTGPGNWSMVSNESLFSIRIDSTSFCHVDSLSPVFDLPYHRQCVDWKIHEIDEDSYQESSKGSPFSATSSSSTNSLVFPILSGETENDISPYPHGSVIGPVPQSPPKPEPAPDRRSNPKASGADTEVKKTTTYSAWTEWFPCFRYCVCCF